MIKTWGNKLVVTGLCVGIPLGLLWVVNLPYPAIRRPIHNRFPLLLLPSQIYIDNNYKQSVRFVRQGQQLVDSATSLEDILLGEQSLVKAQKYLDGIPFMPLEELNQHNRGGYGNRGFYVSFSHFDMQRLRGDVGKLEAKIFQEKNAHNLVTETLSSIDNVKNQYQQLDNEAEKKEVIKEWRSAINKLTEIPASTVARKNLDAKYNNILNDFKVEVGEAYVDEQLDTFIATAQQFSRQAISLANNPPHIVAKWEEVERFWQMAIAELELVSRDDLQAYSQSKKLIAEYSANVAKIRLRKQAEQKSVLAFNDAQQQVKRLLENTPSTPESLNVNKTIADLQNIVNELNKVETDTTVYQQSQNLKVFANNKIQELQQ